MVNKIICKILIIDNKTREEMAWDKLVKVLLSLNIIIQINYMEVIEDNNKICLNPCRIIMEIKIKIILVKIIKNYNNHKIINIIEKDKVIIAKVL